MENGDFISTHKHKHNSLRYFIREKMRMNFKGLNIPLYNVCVCVCVCEQMCVVFAKGWLKFSHLSSFELSKGYVQIFNDFLLVLLRRTKTNFFFVPLQKLRRTTQIGMGKWRCCCFFFFLKKATLV